jgi:hypothetical protein
MRPAFFFFGKEEEMVSDLSENWARDCIYIAKEGARVSPGIVQVLDQTVLIPEMLQSLER